MAPKKAKTVKRDQKHGKNGKKEGLSGSSFFTWFMVIALLGVWTSVAVVWFDLVDYEEFLAKAKDFRYNLSEALQGKLGDYDADGDGDFDVDDAKVLLGLKERIVSVKSSEDHDETDSVASDISDVDLEEAVNTIKESAQPDHDVFDIEDALDDHEIQDDAPSVFSLEDALEPNVHETLSSEPELKDQPEEEPVIEEPAEEKQVEEPVEEKIEEVTEHVLTNEPAATDDDDDVKEVTLTQDEHKTAEHQEPEPAEQVVEEEADTEFLNAPNPETQEPEEVEYEAEPLAAEEAEVVPTAEAELATEEEDEAEVPENQEESETHEELVLTGEEEPSEDDEENEYSPQRELEEEEPVELLDAPEPDGETAPEQTEESVTGTSEKDEDTVDVTEDIVIDDGEEEVNEAQSEEPESPHEHVEVEQNEIPENPVVDDRPSEKVEEHNTAPLEGQQEHHADT